MSCAHSRNAPLLDAHLHLRSPEAAALSSDPVRPAVTLPAELAVVLERRLAAQKDRAALGRLYSPEVVLLQSFGPSWERGRKSGAARSVL